MIESTVFDDGDSRPRDPAVKALLLAFLCTVVVALAAIGSLVYALTQANDTIYKLSADTKCRSEAAADADAAFYEIVIHASSQPRNQAAIDAAIGALREASERRRDIATNGCAD